MTTVLLFHHAQGQTPGFLAFAQELRDAGHTVHAPDVYDRQTFATLDEGIAHAREIGFGEILRRGTEAATDLPSDIVYAGFSMGVMAAVADPDKAGRQRRALILRLLGAVGVRQPVAGRRACSNS